jgi:hypothetical protein
LTVRLSSVSSVPSQIKFIKQFTFKKSHTSNCFILSVTTQLFPFFFKYYIGLQTIREPGSSVSIVSGYWLDDRAMEVRSPAETADSLCVPTGSEAHPASCTMGIGGKARPGVTLTTHPHLVQRSRMSRSYISSPPNRLCGV